MDIIFFIILFFSFAILMLLPQDDIAHKTISKLSPFLSVLEWKLVTCAACDSYYEMQEVCLEFNVYQETWSQKSWSVVTPNCTGFTLRDNKVSFVLNVTLESQKI